jgi:hypothetical protein
MVSISISCVVFCNQGLTNPVVQGPHQPYCTCTQASPTLLYMYNCPKCLHRIFWCDFVLICPELVFVPFQQKMGHIFLCKLHPDNICKLGQNFNWRLMAPNLPCTWKSVNPLHYKLSHFAKHADDKAKNEFLWSGLFSPAIYWGGTALTVK